ncbi:DUF679 domain-containing protein [Cephalotus follicularis]|uniref:DUF679 domain-containing protein n=1 Tax=Cephalotus follicularis TaxID=3775 RepID=A0A1Q3D401_CEPFO|nr:DUF679 domain-containing protein [Cephalotus follicularis]
MENSVQQDLIENCQPNGGYFNLIDHDPNESYYIHVIIAVLNGTARLNVLLPTSTILAFTIFTPLLTNDGECTILSHWLMGLFVVILTASCIFFTFTDSFRTSSSSFYYGVATFRGIWTFNGGPKKPRLPSDYKLRWADIFRASLSSIAFLTFAGSHSDVVACYYPTLPRKVTNSVPLLVGFVVSILLVMLPSKRRGIGYPFLLRRDALYSRC